jgi:16S rRNA (cytidine1402-2'-O)-methyltransferase
VLYIVATPIGNLEDITLRALRVLAEVDMIAAEDTRRTIKLLNHYDIKTKLISFHEHSAPEKREWLISELQAGRDIALVSDAGTPLISDPGAALVAEAAARGTQVTSLPGACAAVVAMTLSGIDGAFMFLGFLPKKKSERRDMIARIRDCDAPCIVYESPHALHTTLADLATVCGQERHVVVAKELTKVHEHVFRGSLGAAVEAFGEDNKGEFVLVIAAAEQATEDISDSDIQAALNECIARGMTKKDAAKATSEKFGISKNRVYKLSI